MTRRPTHGIHRAVLAAAICALGAFASQADAQALDATKFVWEIIKDGGVVTTSDKHINVIPAGTSVSDYTWNPEPAVYENYLTKESWLGFDLVNFTVTVGWRYDGVHLKDFHIDANGFADLMEKVDISVETFDAELVDGVYHLPYKIHFTERHSLGGTTRTTYSGIAFGDGGGESIGF